MRPLPLRLSPARRRGFTLVELIIALVVIAVLAALAIPTYTLVVTSAKDRTTAASLQALDREAHALAAQRASAAASTMTPATQDYTDTLADCAACTAEATGGVLAAGARWQLTGLAQDGSAPATATGQVSLAIDTTGAVTALAAVAPTGHAVYEYTRGVSASTWCIGPTGPADASTALGQCPAGTTVSGGTTQSTTATGLPGGGSSTSSTPTSSPTPSQAPTSPAVPGAAVGCTGGTVPGMPGTSLCGAAATTASGSTGTSTPDKAVDGSMSSAWNAGGPTGTWTATFASTTLSTVYVASSATPAQAVSWTISALPESGSWTQYVTTSVTLPSSPATVTTFQLPSGAYTGLRITVNAGSSWAALNEITIDDSAAVAPSGAPTLTATGVSGGVQLRWTSVPAAYGYRVWRGSTLLGSPAGLTYTDTAAPAGVASAYTVTAYNSVGDGPSSTPASAAPSPPTAYFDAVTASGPTAWWHLGEAAGTTAVAAAGSWPGTYSTGVTLGAPALPNGTNADTAATTTGSTGVSTGYNMTSVTAFTDEAWVKTTATGSQVVLEDRGATGSGGRSITLATGPMGSYCGPGRPFVGLDAENIFIGVCGPTSIADGARHHLVGTWQGASGTGVACGQFALYVDGAPVSTSCITIGSASAPLSGAQGLRIGDGAASGWNTPFAGTIDEPAVYTKALTATDVANHYAAGK